VLLLYRERTQTPPPATGPATTPATHATSAPATAATAPPRPPPRAYIDVVHLWRPNFPATQPLSLPGDLDQAAHFITSDRVLLCSNGDLWITRADADPAEASLSRVGEEHEHVLRDKVVFVHWTYDDKGKR